MMPLNDARWKLATIWFIGAGLLFLMMIVQTILGKYTAEKPAAVSPTPAATSPNPPVASQNQNQEAWSWFLPNFMPTLLLMLGILGQAAFGDAPAPLRFVNIKFFPLTHGLSIFYLAVILLTLIFGVFQTVYEPIQLLTISNFWLAPLQSLTAACIGYLFTAQQ